MSDQQQNDNQIQITKGSIEFILYTDSNTAKIIRSKKAKGNVVINRFITHDSKEYIIQEIDENAFSNTDIESLSFNPDSQVKKIGNYVFEGSKIHSFSIPDSLEEFGENWCYKANFLTNITINDNHPHFQYKNGLLTTKDEQEVIFARRDLKENPILPDNINKIRSNAFFSCKQITSFCPQSKQIESIGPYAFYECENLQLVEIESSNSVTFCEKCFAFCSSLSNFFNKCDEISLKSFCFECCTSISGFDFKSKKISFDRQSITGCEKLASISIYSDDFVDIKDNSFISLYKLDSILIRTKKYSLALDSFEDCTSIKNFYLYSNDDDVNSETFVYLTSLNHINLTSFSKLTIQKFTLSNKKYLQSIRLRSTNLVLEEHCFDGLDYLNSITIECQNQIKFSSEFFKGCKNLKSFKFIKANINLNRSEKVELSENCFLNTEKLEEVEITANAIKLGSSCFGGLKMLQKVVLHCKNLTIDDNCFNGCNSIKSFIVNELKDNGVIEKVDLSENCFLNTEKLEKVEITANDINLGNCCFSLLKNLKSVIFNCKNLTINEKCFNGCESLKTFIISNIPGIGFIEKINLKEKCLLNSKSLENIEIKANDIEIGSSCFINSNIQKVILHCKNLKTNDNCFKGCNYIKSFIVNDLENNGFSEKVELSEKCFLDAGKLNEVKIAANDINIGSRCFNGCNSINSFIISQLESNVITKTLKLSEHCFSKLNGLISIDITANDIEFGSNCFNGSTLQNVILHCKNATIGDNCFKGCHSINSVTITGIEKENSRNEKGAKKIYIGDNCFKGATSLQKVRFYGSSVNISNQCFNNCISLQSFSIDQSTSISIGSKQFIECQNLKTIFIDITKHNSNFLGNHLNLAVDCFKDAPNLSSLEIHGGNDVNITNNLLNCTSISTLKIENVNNIVIGPGMFNQLSELKEIIMSSNTLKIKENCFNGNDKLSHILFKCIHIDIKSNCFNHIDNCQILEFKNAGRIDIDSNSFCYWINNCNIKSIELNAFENLNIGQNCFFQFSNLKKVVFFSKQVTIKSDSFNECRSLEFVNFSPKIVNNFFQNVSKSISHKLQKIENVFIGDNAFNLCDNLKELYISAINNVFICKKCFYNLQNLYTIKISCLHINIDEDSFYHCVGFKKILSIDKPDRRMNEIRYFDIDKKVKEKRKFFEEKRKLLEEKRKEKPDEQKNEINIAFKNDRKFNSFFMIGINRDNQQPSLISMFPAKPVTLSDEIIKSIPLFCYPQGKVKIGYISNKSNIVNGFIFYIGNNEYIGVALHIFIPSSNGIVGDQYDHSYPFCICLISNYPDISSHFSFLSELADLIAAKPNGNDNEDDYIVENDKAIKLLDQKGECYKLLHITPNSKYIALSSQKVHLNFVLPNLINYYIDENLKKHFSNELLLYPTLQVLLTFLRPKTIIELFFCLICEFKIVFISNDLNKSSFCVLALTNLVKYTNSISTYPIFPISYANEANTPIPCVIGYNKKCENDDVDVDLDNDIISFNKKALNVINNFFYITTLSEKAEKIFNDNLKEITIPSRFLWFSKSVDDFIHNADKSIYPECFKYFVKSKYILTIKFIREFCKMIEFPFFPLLKDFIKNFLNIDITVQEEPIAILDANVFNFFIKGKYSYFMNEFIGTQLFTQIKEKLEEEAEASRISNKNENDKYITESKVHINFIVRNLTNHKRSKSCTFFYEKLQVPNQNA